MDRDQWRCRWCGRGPGDNLDIHHIEYRRGSRYDVVENLISLCRRCHGFVHAQFPNARGERILKHVAQGVLFDCIDEPSVTGMQRWRHLRSEWRGAGLCEKHVMDIDDCRECGPSATTS